MIGRLFQAFTLTLLLSGCAVLSCEVKSSASSGRLECPDMRQYANQNRSDCTHDVNCRRKGPGVDPNMKCCPTGKSNTHLCVTPITTFNSSVTELPTPMRKAILPKAETCNLHCRNGLVCRVIDDKAQCVPTLTCAAILCVTGTTCIEEKGRDATCVPQNKPGRPNTDNNSTDQCFADASCAGDQKCCAGVCRKECKTPVNPCAVVRCGFNMACVVINGRASCEPHVRPGQCPNIAIGVINCPTKPRPNSCEDDSVCAKGEKCCANGCGSLVCKKVQPVCTKSSCSSTAGTPVCVEVATTLQQTTNVSPRCSAPSSTNDHCTGKSNACKANQTCLMTRLCVDEPTAVCFPAVTCSEQISENPCNLIDCMPNQQCVVLETFPPQAQCVDNSPVTKPGQCPTLRPGTIGTCIEACTNDFSCTGDSKCCSNGCGRTCQGPAKNPPSTPKPGICPESSRRPCFPKDNTTNQCFDDTSCVGDKKCCDDVCRKECKTPVNPCAVVRCGFNTACVVINGRASCEPHVRPGQCPFVPFICTVFPIPDKCQDDSVCASGEKCCESGCGKTCQAVTNNPPPPPKPGQCPTLLPGTGGICIKACQNDHNCTGDQKCCSNGCGHTCQAPAKTTKSGKCPTLPPGTIGTCVEACTNDFSCKGDSKCCSNGCGHVCKAPAKSATTPTAPTKSTTPVSTTKSAATTLAPPTCAGVKCPYGQCCQQQTIFCVRAPCPQPPPSCVNCQSTSTSTPITTTPKTGKTNY